MSTDICNRLEKLIPPPFVTHDTPRPKTPDLMRCRREVARMRKGNYYNHVELMLYEIDFLTGFVVRKGQQLRREKAFQLTSQILKLAHRWKGNELLKNFNNFRLCFTIKQKLTILGSPSRQWTAYMVYLMMREAALVAKMKVACESAVEYWLGLISEAHHWGDSLVITAILSRIWLISSNIVRDLIYNLYPTYYNLYNLLPPTESTAWPDEDWIMPPLLDVWIRDTMKLSFETARLNVSISYFGRNSATNDITSILSKSYEQKAATTETKVMEVKQEQMDADDIIIKAEPVDSETESANDPPFFLDTKGIKMESEDDFPYDENFVKEEEEEDLGVVVKEEETEPPKKKKKKVKQKLSNMEEILTGLAGPSDHLPQKKKQKVVKNKVPSKKGPATPSIQCDELRRDRWENPTDPTPFIAYWNAFSMKFTKKLNCSKTPMKKLISRVYSYKMIENKGGFPQIHDKLGKFHEDLLIFRKNPENLDIHEIRIKVKSLLGEFDLFIKKLAIRMKNVAKKRRREMRKEMKIEG